MTRSICRQFVDNVFFVAFYWFCQPNCHWWRHNQQIIYVSNSMEWKNHVKIICVGVNQLLVDESCGSSYNQCNFRWIFHFCWNWLSKRCPKLIFRFFQFCVGGWLRGLIENTHKWKIIWFRTLWYPYGFSKWCASRSKYNF